MPTDNTDRRWNSRGEGSTWPDSDELDAAEALVLLANCNGGFCSTSPIATAPKQPSSTPLPTTSHPNSATPAAAANVETQQPYSPDTPLAATSSTFHPKKHRKQPPSRRPESATASAAVSVNKQKTYSPDQTSHDCSVCGKRFQSHQALGGHMTTHRKKPQTATASDVGNSSAAKRGIHECSTCHEMFPSGQALGGHMRKHFDRQLLTRRPANSPDDSAAAAAASHVTELNIDSNMPPPEE